MILRHLAVCFGVEIDGINIDILKVLVWGAASPVSIGIYCDCFGSVSIGSIYGIFWSVLMHGLASVVRVRSPSASSAPLKRAQSGAPSAHPALETPLCARERVLFRTCSSSASSFSETASAVARRRASTVRLRSPIRTDGSSDGCSPDGLGI